MGLNIGVIGAGIVGVTTAYELAHDGHRVTVYERRSSVAEENSFAHAGIVAPGCVTPWATPGLAGGLVRQLLHRPGLVRLARPMAPGQTGWMWRAWQQSRPQAQAAALERLHRLGRYSLHRLQQLRRTLALEVEQQAGYLVLLRGAREVAVARQATRRLADLGVRFRLLDADQARQAEPGLNPEMPLQAAVQLPDDLVGNGRQFAHLLRGQAQQQGASFRFNRRVTRLEADGTVHHAPADGRTAEGRTTDTEPGESVDRHDAVVVCAALGSRALLAPLGLALPLQPVHGYAMTASLRQLDGYPHLGPRSAVLDERHQVVISRIGQRVRVAGGAELGGRADQIPSRVAQALQQALDDWFPGCAQHGTAQLWKGARPTLPDGLPLIGAGPAPGIWLNVGHGGHGWALACGSARLLADGLARRAPAIDTDGWGLDRLAASRAAAVPVSA